MASGREGGVKTASFSCEKLETITPVGGTQRQGCTDREDSSGCKKVKITKRKLKIT